MSKCRSKLIKRKLRQLCFIHSGWIERHAEAAVRTQTSADFNLKVTGSTNTNVWNKCSFEPLWKITRKSAHGDKPLWGHSELQRWLQPSPSRWTREVSLIAPIWCFICRNQSLVFRVHDQRKNCPFFFFTRENCFGLVLASFWFYIHSRSNTDVEFVFRLPSVKFYEFPKISPPKISHFILVYTTAHILFLNSICLAQWRSLSCSGTEDVNFSFHKTISHVDFGSTRISIGEHADLVKQIWYWRDHALKSFFINVIIKFSVFAISFIHCRVLMQQQSLSSCYIILTEAAQLVN